MFTGFAIAGYGMAKHHLARRARRWRGQLVVNLSAAIVSTIVVGIFAVAKFTEGAWLIVVVFPLLVLLLMRLHREYQAEAEVLEQLTGDEGRQTSYTRRKAILLVGAVDLAVLEALRYARGLDSDQLTAVHFMVDEAVADRIRRRWDTFRIPATLEIIECPDRRVTHAAQELVLRELAGQEDTGITVLLPRRSYSPLLGRLLHDHTADQLALTISRIPHAVATIVPYDVRAGIRRRFAATPGGRLTAAMERILLRIGGEEERADRARKKPAVPARTTAISSLVNGQSATVEGRVHDIEQDETPRAGRAGLDRAGADQAGPAGRVQRRAYIEDDSGSLMLEFRATDPGPDIVPGAMLRVTGRARRRARGPMTMVDAGYRVLSGADEDETAKPDSPDEADLPDDQSPM